MSGTEPESEISARLREIADYLIEVADRSGDSNLTNRRPAVPLGKVEERRNLRLLSKIAKEELDQRRKRSLFFETELFGEPAWDILLDLFVAHVEEKKISVTSACIAACVPPTTALRWLSILEQHNLVSRSADEFDHRRTWIQLTNKSIIKISNYLNYRNSKAHYTDSYNHHIVTDF